MARTLLALIGVRDELVFVTVLGIHELYLFLGRTISVRKRNN